MAGLKDLLESQKMENERYTVKQIVSTEDGLEYWEKQCKLAILGDKNTREYCKRIHDESQNNERNLIVGLYYKTLFREVLSAVSASYGEDSALYETYSKAENIF